QVGFAIRGARRGRGEVRFAIGSAGDAGRWMVYPLRGERRHRGSQDDHRREDLHSLNSSRFATYYTPQGSSTAPAVRRWDQRRTHGRSASPSSSAYEAATHYRRPTTDGTRTFAVEPDFIYTPGERNTGILRTGLGTPRPSPPAIGPVRPEGQHFALVA